MKRTVFLSTFLLLLAALFVMGGIGAAILYPVSSADFWNRQLPVALGVLPVLVVIALGAAWAVAGAVVDPVSRIDPDCPGENVPYTELVPIVAKLRAQNRELRRLREELSLSAGEISAITENMAESFLLLDKRMNVTFRNNSARYLFPTGDPEGPDNLIRCQCPPEVIRAAGRALMGTRTELTIPLRERSYHVIATPVFSEKTVSGAVMVALDTTEEQEREKLRREFSANVSHELKTPLTSIAGFAELMKDGLVPPERMGEFAGDIYRESQRSIALVDDIMELSRLEGDTAPPEWEQVELRALAEEILAQLRPAGEAKHLTFNLRGGGSTVRGVRTALRELVFNLCDNAVKYNRDSGSVTVTTEQEGGHCRLTVEDTGIGIPYEHQSRVFERFYRVDKSHSRSLGGTGLGLSIAKHAAQMHAARLELWSEPGVGTRITVDFPVDTQEEKNEHEEEHHGQIQDHFRQSHLSRRPEKGGALQAEVRPPLR